MTITKDIETYLLDGCGRCDLGGTPDCKVHQWSEILQALMGIARSMGLEETVKWGVPCYMIDGKVVFLISALKESSVISFFKGVLLDDPKSLLVKPGPNSHAGRYLKFTSPSEVVAKEEDIRWFMDQAIKAEREGLPMPAREIGMEIPEALEKYFAQDTVFRDAFEALTPGRQRGYLIYFNGAKQEQTRISRIEKCIPNILHGIGLHDHYMSNKLRK